MLMSTLRNYIDAVEGNLTIVVELPNKPGRGQYNITFSIVDRNSCTVTERGGLSILLG